MVHTYYLSSLPFKLFGRLSPLHDFFILFLFVGFYLLNLTYVVQAGDFLASTKQENALSRCRGHAYVARSLFPTRTLPVRAHHAGVIAIVLGGALFIGEFVWWSSFRSSFPYGTYLFAFTLARDILLVLTTILLLVWYCDRNPLRE
ncbi:MAG: hypothetical protein Q8Q12_15080 [bacterium]|nr:hypothetical protein [bacterium]